MNARSVIAMDRELAPQGVFAVSVGRVAERELREPARGRAGRGCSSPVSVERTMAGAASTPRPRDTEKNMCCVAGFTAMSRITT